MRWLLAPEPCDWLPAVTARLQLTPADQLFAPWALPGTPPAWLGQRFRAAWTRRQVTVAGGAEVLTLPGWSALEGAMRLAAHSSARRYQSRFALRQMLSHLAARRLPSGVTEVIAPSLAARELFARARSRGARCILVEDLPSLRQLHSDLDAAARHHPAARFLSNHRAAASDVARQEAERVLADERWVRAPFTAALLREAGHGAEPLPLRMTAPATRPIRGRTLLLAGGACARAGVYEALAALDARPHWTLRARDAEGTEPAARYHSRVQLIRGKVALGDVDAVLAPAWSEQHSAEVEAASREGVPLIATSRAASWTEYTPVPVGDVGALVRALDELERADSASS